MRIMIIFEIFLYIKYIFPLENLAFNKSVWEDQPWRDPRRNWGAVNAVDRRYFDRSAAGGQCVINENYAHTATLGVDLGGVVSISHIDIFYRTDNIPCCSNVGYFGPTCSIPCPTNCQGRRCDVNTGHCLGCLPGYQGMNCGEVCKQQTYGVACSQACGYCSNGEACHPANGTCVNGCMEGVMGTNCKIECPLGHYGKNCVYNCSENFNVTRRCNRFTGECDGGMDRNCVRSNINKCEDGFFVSDCTSVCGHCLNANQCHFSNGTCLNGCSAGYIGTHCKEKCPSGTFGLECDNKCHLFCTGNTSCNHVTGVCIQGCKKGWKGPLCNGDHQEPLSNGDNVTVIGIVVSFIIVLTGAVLSYIYWRRSRAKNLKGRQFKDLSYENAKEKTNENFQENSQQYTELQEVNPYEEIHAYSN